MARLNNYKAYIAIGLICALIGFIVGFISGETVALNWAVEKAYYLLDLKGIQPEINSGLVAMGLAMYRQNIDQLMPPLNVSK